MCKAVLYSSNSFDSYVSFSRVSVSRDISQMHGKQRPDITRPGFANPKAGESECQRLAKIKYNRFPRAKISLHVFTLCASFLLY